MEKDIWDEFERKKKEEEERKMEEESKNNAIVINDIMEIFGINDNMPNTPQGVPEHDIPNTNGTPRIPDSVVQLPGFSVKDLEKLDQPTEVEEEPAQVQQEPIQMEVDSSDNDDETPIDVKSKKSKSKSKSNKSKSKSKSKRYIDEHGNPTNEDPDKNSEPTPGPKNRKAKRRAVESLSQMDAEEKSGDGDSSETYKQKRTVRQQPSKEMVLAGDLRTQISNGTSGISYSIRPDGKLLVQTMNGGKGFRIVIKFEENCDYSDDEAIKTVEITKVALSTITTESEEGTEAHDESADVIVVQNTCTIDCQDTEHYSPSDRVRLQVKVPQLPKERKSKKKVDQEEDQEEPDAPKAPTGISVLKPFYHHATLSCTERFKFKALLMQLFRDMQRYESSSILVGQVIVDMMCMQLQQGKSFANHIGKNMFAFAATLAVLPPVHPTALTIIQRFMKRTYDPFNPSGDFQRIMYTYVKVCNTIGAELPSETNVINPGNEWGFKRKKNTNMRELLFNVSDTVHNSPPEGLKKTIDIIKKLNAQLLNTGDEEIKDPETNCTTSICELLKEKQKSMMTYWYALRFVLLFKGQQYFSDAIPFINEVIKANKELKKRDKELAIATANLEVAEKQTENLKAQLANGTNAVAQKEIDAKEQEKILMYLEENKKALGIDLRNFLKTNKGEFDTYKQIGDKALEKINALTKTISNSQKTISEMHKSLEREKQITEEMSKKLAQAKVEEEKEKARQEYAETIRNQLDEEPEENNQTNNACTRFLRSANRNAPNNAVITDA